MNVVEYKDFTDDSIEENEKALHGTFMSSLIGSNNSECMGIAPEADLFILKVFNKNHESYTEWFLEAFNFALK